MKSSPSILETSQKDFQFFILPGLLAVLFSFFFNPQGLFLQLYVLLTAGLIGSGHVYLTIWRVYLDPQEFLTNKKKALFIPFAIFVVISILLVLKFKNFWLLIVLLDGLHHVLQWVGLQRVQSRLSPLLGEQKQAWLGRVLLVLLVLPMMIYPFRKEILRSFYLNNMLPELGWSWVPNLFILLYILTLLAWALIEVRHFRDTKQTEFSRIGFMAFIVALYGYCFLYGKNFVQTLGPLLVSHGLSYLALTSETVSKKKIRNIFTFSQAIQILSLTALVFGILELVGENYVFDISESYLHSTNLWEISSTALYLTPLVSHFIFDILFWKQKNSRLI